MAAADGTMTVLVTGAAGFIGYHVADRLLRDGVRVVGLDNLNSYYDVRLKEARLARLRGHNRFAFVRAALEDRQAIEDAFAEHRFTHVVNLAAQAGVRHSLEAPRDYIDSNIVGFMNILECCRHGDVAHLVYASSSSVYGGNEKLPFSVSDNVDHPKSLYAATKKANELMAHAYSSLYGIPTTGLRFFTVYGPWGRPDMAMYLFLDAIYGGKPIRVFNNGDMIRDFTYIDDIVESVVRLVPRAAAPDPGFDPKAPDPATSWAPARVYNIGNSRQEHLMHVIGLLEQATGIEAAKEFLPMQPGDVQATWADTAALEAAIGFTPDTPIEEGVRRYVAWYRDYHGK
jgi:UDP-glucuronate 4-epimerase